MEIKAPTAIPQQEIDRQFGYIERIAAYSRDAELRTGQKPFAYIQTFGCQQNEADSERIAGMLHDMGYGKAESPEQADVLIYNTCAVREHAESRALGNIGALSHLKKQRPDITIGLCGCMVQQEHMPDKIRKSYPQVNLLFGTHALWRLPELEKSVFLIFQVMYVVPSRKGFLYCVDKVQKHGCLLCMDAIIFVRTVLCPMYADGNEAAAQRISKRNSVHLLLRDIKILLF